MGQGSQASWRTAELQCPTGICLMQVVEMLRQRVLTVNELLRHMWACFPLASQQRQTKAARLASALSSQQEG